MQSQFDTWYNNLTSRRFVADEEGSGEQNSGNIHSDSKVSGV